MSTLPVRTQPQATRLRTPSSPSCLRTRLQSARLQEHLPLAHSAAGHPLSHPLVCALACRAPACKSTLPVCTWPQVTHLQARRDCLKQQATQARDLRAEVSMLEREAAELQDLQHRRARAKVQRAPGQCGSL